LIEKWDGGAWSIVSSPNSGGYNDLRGVTCASKEHCWAVGSYGAGGPNQTFIEHWNGILWTIVSSPNTSTMENNYLSAVACASASNCWAVGYYGGNGAFQTLAEQWDGNIWTIVSSPNPSGAHDSEFLGVTCASVEQCWAAGFYVTNGPPRTLVEMWQGPTPRPRNLHVPSLNKV